MKQRIKLAQSLIHDPPLLFLDEPTSGLDPSGRDAMLDLLQTLHKDHGKSFLLCTHLLGDVERTCKDMILLSGGQVLLRERVSSLSRTIPSEFRVRLLQIPPNSVLPEHWKPEGDGFVVHLGSKRGTSDGSVSDQNRVTEDTRLIWREASQMGAIVSHISPRHEDLRERFAQILAEAGGGKELREKKQTSSLGPTQKTGGPNE
jgi:ABC-2 type transport system ATP-binding protein